MILDEKTLKDVNKLVEEIHNKVDLGKYTGVESETKKMYAVATYLNYKEQQDLANHIKRFDRTVIIINIFNLILLIVNLLLYFKNTS